MAYRNYSANKPATKGKFTEKGYTTVITVTMFFHYTTTINATTSITTTNLNERTGIALNCNRSRSLIVQNSRLVRCTLQWTEIVN